MPATFVFNKILVCERKLIFATRRFNSKDNAVMDLTINRVSYLLTSIGLLYLKTY